MDLFDYMRENQKDDDSPLAKRMRPESLDEVIGQEHIIGKEKLLYRAIKADKLSSLIFYGPPGTGKTTLAMVIAHTTKADFKAMYGKRTILFIDEIHRFNKSQQDYLLPFVEDGTIILIGATTENPYFEVNGALISRSNIFELKPLSKENIKEIILKAVYDQKGMGAFNACIDDDAVEFLSDMSEGDARSALNAVELGVLSSEPEADGQIHITLSVAEECIQRRAFRYDKDGDNHYDIISAFIKSMRGSDPDAAVFYLAKMLCGGESITFIARRIMICACEDVGNADPNAICVATACAQAVERVGMPEAQIILAHAAIVNAIFSAKNVVEHEQTGQVPVYLRDAHYGGAKKLGHTGYKYAHDYPNHYVKQQYLPDEIADRQFYEPTDNGYEQNIKQYFKKIKEEL